MGKVVSFINMKGGVGKTTLSVNIGFTLSSQFDKKVLLIDADPQMNATQYTLSSDQIQEIIDNQNNSLYGVLHQEYGIPVVTRNQPEQLVDDINVFYKIDNSYDLIPSHLQIMSLNLNEHPLRLRQFIRDNNLKDKYDVILIDSPPTISAYTKISLLASDDYIVPMKTDFLSLFGLPLLDSYITMLNRDFELEPSFSGIVLTMVRPDWRIYKQVKTKLLERPDWRTKLFANEIKYRTIVDRVLAPEERARNLPYMQFIQDDELSTQIMTVTEEFIRKVRL